jgi:hypothetical protein
MLREMLSSRLVACKRPLRRKGDRAGDQCPSFEVSGRESRPSPRLVIMNLGCGSLGVWRRRIKGVIVMSQYIINQLMSIVSIMSIKGVAVGGGRAAGQRGRKATGIVGVG